MSDADLKELERKVRKLLTDFENDHNVRIDHVEVDTRNFANLRTEIFLDAQS